MKLRMLLAVTLLLAASLTASVASAAGTVVVRLSSPNGWGFVQDSGSTGSMGFAGGPAGVPLGSGSVHLTTAASGDGLLIGAVINLGTPLADITRLEYSTYEDLGSSGTVQAISLQLNVDADSTDSITGWQGRLVFEPYYSEPVTKGVWQTWDTLTQGRWWGTGAPINTVSRWAVRAPGARCWPTSPTRASIRRSAGSA